MRENPSRAAPIFTGFLEATMMIFSKGAAAAMLGAGVFRGC
jgi:hypothetical protein